MHDKQEDAILTSYTPGAVFIDPSGKRFSTPEQRRKLYDQVFATYDSDLHFDRPTIVMHATPFTPRESSRRRCAIARLAQRSRLVGYISSG
jgi:ketosteroid isomerase-like protein